MQRQTETVFVWLHLCEFFSFNGCFLLYPFKSFVIFLSLAVVFPFGGHVGPLFEENVLCERETVRRTFLSGPHFFKSPFLIFLKMYQVAEEPGGQENKFGFHLDVLVMGHPCFVDALLCR